MMCLLAAAVLANAVVTQPVANMFSGPSADKDVVSQAIFGTNVAVVDEQPGWAKIQTPDQYLGWTPDAGIRRGATYAKTGRVARVAVLFANLYRETDVTKHEPVLTLPFESRLEVVAEPAVDGARWIQVRLPDDRSAWIQRGDVTFESKKLSIPETVRFAKRFLGLPYLWGGVSTFGYDCSGFMQMLGRERGVAMPRDAQPQADWSGVIPVRKEDLQAGDLLYFGPSEKKITHTGMYIGNDEFIHATAYRTPVVQISRLSDPHWAGLLVACRRLK